MGNVVQAGLGQNPARQAALKGGLDPRVAAMTINKVCGSGLKAVGLAAQAVTLGESEIVVAGGMESMSNAPYLMKGARAGFRLGNAELLDSMIADGLWDVYENFHMGQTAELVAEKYGISRAGAGPVRAREPSEGGARHEVVLRQRADRSRSRCPQRKGPPVVIKTDESPREDYFARSAREAQARVQEGRRHGDRRQRARHERRRRGGGRDERKECRAAGKGADGAHRRAGRERRRAEVGDDGAGGRGRKAARENRLGPR